MNTCPHCQRRLLTQASARCNWCGQEIPDAAYQQEAGAKREAFFVEQALHDAASLAGIEAINVNPMLPGFDPLLGVPLGLSLAPRRPVVVMPPPPPAPVEAPPADDAPPEPETGGRFSHLELE